MSVEALVVITAALIGATGALAATFEAGRRARREVYRKEVRLAAAQLTRTLGAASHSIEWLVWKATYSPAEVDPDSIADYNEELHLALSQIVGDLALVSALDSEIYKRMYPLARELFALDEDVALSAARFSRDSEASVAALADLSGRAFTYHRGLNERVAGILGEAHFG